MKDINVQYLSISEDTKYAYEAADKAIRQAEFAEAANEQLGVIFCFRNPGKNDEFSFLCELNEHDFMKMSKEISYHYLKEGWNFKESI